MIADTVTKPKRTKGKSYADMADNVANSTRLTAVGASRPSSDQVTVIPLAQLIRHPLNREIDPSSDEVKQLAASIAEHGQLEPMRVRPTNAGVPYYQIISGERRYHALTLAGSYGAKCIIVNCDDATALKEVAAANSNRQDLNPVERGEMMQSLMRGVDDGGAGLSLLEAGAIYGLTSESGCKNALRLMRLPKSILDLVTSGDLPERHARKLVPYVEAKPVIDEIAKDLTSKDGYSRQEILTELLDDQPFHVATYHLNQLVRPISPDIKRHNPYPMADQPCLFNWEERETDLQIVEIPTECGYDKKHRVIIEPRKWAMNTKLWDKLQQPFLDKIKKDGDSRKNKSTKPGSKSPKQDSESTKLTPAQLAAEAKRKAAEADKRLDAFTDDWIQRLLRSAIAERSIDDELVARTLPWLTSCVSCFSGVSLRSHSEQSLAELQMAGLPKGHSIVEQLPIVAKISKAGIDEVSKSFELLATYWRLIVWPVSQLISDKASGKCRLTPAGELPERMAHINEGELRVFAQIAGVSAESAWKLGVVDGSDQRRLIAVWLCRHTKDQLHKLRNELHVTEGSSTMGRDELADCILNAHRAGRPLPLPKRLAKWK